MLKLPGCYSLEKKFESAKWPKGVLYTCLSPMPWRWVTYKVLFEDNFKVDLLRGRATVSRTRTRVKQEMLKCMGNIFYRGEKWTWHKKITWCYSLALKHFWSLFHHNTHSRIWSLCSLTVYFMCIILFQYIRPQYSHRSLSRSSSIDSTTGLCCQQFILKSCSAIMRTWLSEFYSNMSLKIVVVVV